jgi:hypothetical protein
MNPLHPETNSEDRRVTRAELYAKVWSEPMVKVAKEFGISDRGLAKTCNRLEVPVPPRGYWAKLQAGKPASKLPLPAAKPFTTTGTVIRRTPPSEMAPEPPPREPELQARIDTALASCVPIKVPKSLSNTHSIIRGWMDEDTLALQRTRESIYAPHHLSITRTQTGRRRLRVLSALLREFERIGYRVAAARRAATDHCPKRGSGIEVRRIRANATNTYSADRERKAGLLEQRPRVET